MKIIFYGGTGQNKVMRSIADRLGSLVAVLDDTEEMSPTYEDVPFYCGKNCFLKWKESTPDWKNHFFAVTIGNPHAESRILIAEMLMKEGLKPLTLVHHSSIIDSRVEIGEGSQIHSGSIISYGARLGKYCIVNTGSILEHDSIIEDGVELGPGSVICGEVIIGKNTWIGAGATIKNGIKIGSNCIIGAGSVVIRDVGDFEIVVGNPAKFLKENKIK